jgi:hypothetical protein
VLEKYVLHDGLRDHRSELMSSTSSPGNVYHLNEPWVSTALRTSEEYEKVTGDALDFFARRFQWTQSEREEREQVHPYQRLACRSCRKEYGMHLFIPKGPTIDETVDDMLRGELIYKNSIGYTGRFQPCFYSGGAFDSRFVRETAREIYKVMNTFRAQMLAERSRFVEKHGSTKGYKPRFVYGDNVDEVFDKASESTFPKPARAPIGLNPERFIERCEGCQQWLHDCEFGVKYCELCKERKPRAKA